MSVAEQITPDVATLSPAEAGAEAMRRMSPMLRELRTVLDCWCRELAARDVPGQLDVDALRYLLDLMADFPSNDQRARYLLSSNWMRERDAQAARRARRPCFACEAKVQEKRLVLALIERSTS